MIALMIIFFGREPIKSKLLTFRNSLHNCVAKKEPNLQLDGYFPSEYREFAVYCEMVSFSMNSLRSRLNLLLRLS